MVLTSVGQNKQIERNTTFGLIFFFFFFSLWLYLKQKCRTKFCSCFRMSNSRAMSSQSPSSGHNGNQKHLLLFFLQPSFFCGEWGYMVWNISLASSGQGLQLCSLPTSCSVLGCGGWKDGSRWAPMKKVNSILARPSTPSLCGFLGKIQQISCFLYSSYWAWLYMS